jgi:hypothetical protein
MLVRPHSVRAVTNRLRALSEAEAYARCYGGGRFDVRIVKVQRRPRYDPRVSGEDLRQAFEQRLEGREPDGAAAHEPEAA